MSVNNREMIRADLVSFVRQEIPVERVMALADLVRKCENRNINISKVLYYRHGFMVEFEGISGDACLHDNTYGKDRCQWETAGMPWDHGDTGTHDAHELAWMMEGVKNTPADKRYVLELHVGMGGYYHEQFADEETAISRAKYLADRNAIDVDCRGEIVRSDRYQLRHYGYIIVLDEWSKETLWRTERE